MYKEYLLMQIPVLSNRKCMTSVLFFLRKQVFRIWFLYFATWILFTLKQCRNINSEHSRLTEPNCVIFLSPSSDESKAVEPYLWKCQRPRTPNADAGSRREDHCLWSTESPMA